MSRYNAHFANHFGGCMLLALARDPHRNRDVQLRMLPGEFDHVGVTDGTDAWIAPVAGDPFGVGIKRILDGVREGRMPAPHAPMTRKPRRTLIAAPAAENGPPRAIPEQAPTATTRPRRQLTRQA